MRTGLVPTSDMWLAPRIPAMKEVADFNLKYAKAIDVTGTAGASGEQLRRRARAMYPDLQKALARMQAEGSKVDGTPLESVLLVEGARVSTSVDLAALQVPGGFKQKS